MKPLSPVDAISPAFSRMRTLLTPPDPRTGQPGPFRFWFFVKMTVIGALSGTGFYQGTFVLAVDGILFFSMAMSHRAAFSRSSMPQTFNPGAPILIAIGLFGGFIALAIWIVLGWLWSRLRFTLFDLVLYRHGQAGIGWSRYGSQAWRYLGLMVLASLILLVVLAATAGPIVLRLVVALRQLTPQEINANPGLVFAHILPLYAVILPFSLLIALMDAVLQDFLLPPMALENAPIEGTAGRFFHLLRTYPGQVLLYLLLRLVLVFGLTVAGSMAVFAVLVVVGGLGAGGGFVAYHAFAHSGAAGMAVFVLCCIVAAAVVLTVYLLSIVSLQGLVGIFKQCFAVCFYGSYYPALGDRLEPPPAPAPVAPQPPPSGNLPEPPPVW